MVFCLINLLTLATDSSDAGKGVDVFASGDLGEPV